MRISDWSSDVCSSDLTILATGVAMRFGWLPLPEHLAALQILANPWVLGVAAVGTLAEFLADKIAWVDSIWDAVHSIVRPLGGALLALALVDSSDPAWQVIAFLLGGGGALLRSEEHTSALQSLMRISYAVFCLKKKN